MTVRSVRRMSPPLGEIGAESRTNALETNCSRRCHPLPSTHLPRRTALRRSGDPNPAQHLHVSQPALLRLVPDRALTLRIGLGVASMGLVIVYPFMKRITYYPQITFGAPRSENVRLRGANGRGDVHVGYPDGLVSCCRACRLAYGSADVCRGYRLGRGI